MISEKDLLAAYIHFDPALYTKRVKKYQVYLLPASGSIVKGRFAGITLHKKMDKVFGKRTVVIAVPAVLMYDNRPEYDVQEFPISNLTRETLQQRIREEFDRESMRIRQTSPR